MGGRAGINHCLNYSGWSVPSLISYLGADVSDSTSLPEFFDPMIMRDGELIFAAWPAYLPSDWTVDEQRSFVYKMQVLIKEAFEKEWTK